MIEAMVNKIEKIIAESIAAGDESEYFEGYKKTKGATEEELQAFEAEFDISLPDDFKALYKYKDGSSYPFNLLYTTYNKECMSAFYLLSLAEIRKVKLYFCNEDKLMANFSDFFSNKDITGLDKRIKPFLFNKRWIPFASLAGGSLYLMLDFDPAENGTSGQIIIYVHDPDFIYYVSKNIQELLQDTTDNLESGWYEEFHE